MTDYMIRVSGNDLNGGTSAVIRSSGNNGVTNGSNTFTSVTGTWSAADIGQIININSSNLRKITAVASATSLTFSGAAMLAGSGKPWVIGGPWRTPNFALSNSSTVVTGDVIYVGAGMYRSTGLSISPASNYTTETKMVGDIDGSKTGDAGEIIFTAAVNGDSGTFGTSANVSLNNTNFLTFENITFNAANAANIDAISSGTPHDITFRRCTFVAIAPFAASMGLTATVNVSLNWTFDSCIVMCPTGFLLITVPTSASADYNLNILIKNCFIYVVQNASTAISASPSGANSFKGGGINIYNSTIMSPGGAVNLSGLSTTFLNNIKNCILLTGSTVLTAGTTASIVEDYNWLGVGTLRNNITAGIHSKSYDITMAYPEIGQSFLYNMKPRPFMSPSSLSPLAFFGNDMSIAPIIDALGRPIPSNGVILDYSGTATSAAANTFTDSGAAWGIDQWKTRLIKITGGTGSGQIKRIDSNTATVLTTGSAGQTNSSGPWATTPDATSTYQIFNGHNVETGVATGGSTTTLIDVGARWGTTKWIGYVLSLTGGTGSGQTTTVISHTNTTLTFGTLGTAPVAGTTYSLYTVTSIDQNYNPIGAYGRHDAAVKETTVYDVAPNSIRIDGPGDQEFRIPVVNASTTISLKMRYDSNHGATNKPQAVLVAAPEIGVTTETLTMSAAADTWEKLTFTPQTPSGKGVVVVRICARPNTVLGRCYADTFSVS